MKVATPHYLLFSESSRKNEQNQWRFVLQSIDGAEQLEATDEEAGAHGERLELLAVVRGLEAIDGPARVTLVTPSKYVNRGIAFGLDEWRASGWEWEHYGEMVPVKNRDLWQRVDRALQYHQVECRTWRFDLPHTGAGESRRAPVAAQAAIREPQRVAKSALRPLLQRAWGAAADWLAIQRRAVSLWLAEDKSRYSPLAWFQ